VAACPRTPPGVDFMNPFRPKFKDKGSKGKLINIIFSYFLFNIPILIILYFFIS
jgi:uncharacterized membrane-anchored protein YitT (DUF2179 family)